MPRPFGAGEASSRRGTPFRFALNAIQWSNGKADPDDPESADVWLYREPSFRADYPKVLAQVRRAGFDAVMMEVLDTQTLQNYKRMVEEAGLALAPGYCQVGLPEDVGLSVIPGTAEWVRWFDAVRRRAEESNFLGLSTVFLAPEPAWESGVRMVEQAAVGADFSQDRLDRVVETLAAAADVLVAEGIRPGLHNHVGSWVETEYETDYVLAQIDDALLGASFDLGHLAWAGIDPVAMIAKHRDRIVDLHIKDIDLDVAEHSRRVPAPYTTSIDRCVSVEPGAGGLDLTGALAELSPTFDGWLIVEVDHTALHPDDSARLSWNWVESTFQRDHGAQPAPTQSESTP